MACKVSVVWSGRCLWYGLEGVCGMVWKVSVWWSEGCLGDGLTALCGYLNGAVRVFERCCAVI